MRASDVRTLIESHNGNTAAAAVDVLHLAGLVDASGRRYRDAGGNPTLRDPVDGQGRPVPRMKPSEFSLRALSEGMLGESGVENYLKPDLVRRVADLVESQGRDVLEDNGAGAVLPSAFANINAFTAATAGLMEVSILEGWQAPEFIADTLAPVEATRMFEGRKTIGATRIGDLAEERLPGMPTKRVQIGERWIEQPRTVENSLACEVTQEAIYLDLTGQIPDYVEQANGVGEWLGYRKELRVIDAFIGVTNTYKYKGTAYNTYIAAGYYDNDFSNDLQSIDNVLAAEVKFRDMKDPDTNTRVMIRPDTVLVQKEREYFARMIFGGNDAQFRSDPTAGSGAVQKIVSGPNPVRQGTNYTVLQSPLVFERINASTGLNVSASNAAKYWWMFQKGWLRYAQNMPLRVQTAAPNSIDMIDRGVVLYAKADERGVPYVKEPRKVVRCKS